MKTHFKRLAIVGALSVSLLLLYVHFEPRFDVPVKESVQDYIPKYNEILEYRNNRNGGFQVYQPRLDLLLGFEAEEDRLIEQKFRQHTPKLWPRQKIAMATYLIYREYDDAFKFDVGIYKPYVHATVSNLIHYAQEQNYPFYFLNDHIVDSHMSSFWAKLHIIKHYLNKHKNSLDWLLYTDTDVLILRQEIPLEAFIQPCAEHHHFIGVLEPGHHDAFDNYGGLIRSGFFMIRNSPEGRQFIDTWIDKHQVYKDFHNPEQTALEHMFASDDKEFFCMHSSMSMHSYNEHYRDGMFSVHFPSPFKKPVIPQFYEHYIPGHRDFMWDVIQGKEDPPKFEMPPDLQSGIESEIQQ
ncbi:hypothetical protein EDD86DRAFT_259975 [Gorgonomyces haynaldii]|nr:hypothetical protein EDD86DRAFT_259975 [Gorgonomyces haynaldii]